MRFNLLIANYDWGVEIQIRKSNTKQKDQILDNITKPRKNQPMLIWKPAQVGFGLLWANRAKTGQSRFSSLPMQSLPKLP